MHHPQLRLTQLLLQPIKDQLEDVLAAERCRSDEINTAVDELSKVFEVNTAGAPENVKSSAKTAFGNLKRLGKPQEQVFRLEQSLNALSDTSCNRKTVREYIILISDFLLGERLERVKKAQTKLALYLDESTDAGNTSTEILCCSYICRHGKLRSEVLAVFDVSRAGDTAGAAIELAVKKFLKDKGIYGLVDFLDVDGASNVCGYPSRGHTNSFSAIFRRNAGEAQQHVALWWCNCHRLNLCLSDVIKECGFKDDFIPFLQKLISWLKSSSSRLTALKDNVADVEQLVESLGDSIRELERRILDLNPGDAASRAQAADLRRQCDDGKIRQEVLEAELKKSGKQRRLAGYLVVRWLSLFNTVQSIWKLYERLLDVLRADAGNGEANGKEDAGDDEDDDGKADADEEEKDEKKLTKSEKAAILITGLEKHKFLIAFLKDFGDGYRTLIKAFQATKTTFIHTAFMDLLEFKQKLMSMCLRIVPQEVDAAIPDEAEDDHAQPDEPKQPRLRISTEKAAQRLAWCLAECRLKSQNNMISCSSAGMCRTQTRQDPDRRTWFHIRCIDMSEKDFKKIEKKRSPWYCKECTEARGVNAALDGSAAHVRGANFDDQINALPHGFAAQLPDPDDLRAQIWNQDWRLASCINPLIKPKPTDDVTFAQFPTAHEVLDEEADKTAMKELGIKFCHKFVQFMNQRFMECDDWQVMEACTLLNPVWKAKNQEMRVEYIRRLVSRFGNGGKTESDIRNGATHWYMLANESNLCKPDMDVISYWHMAANSYEHVRVFALWALNILKNILATALVENFFSTVTMLKSKFRMSLSTDVTQAAVVMRTEADTFTVPMRELTSRILASGLKMPAIGEKRGHYKQKPEKPAAEREERPSDIE